jgi:catechol 2,3-dioxygenase-like lactoylglutathione lyase family enzyme
MFKEWSRRRAVQRVKQGNGRPLKRFRWWQQLSRALFYLPPRDDDGRQTVYAVDVRYLQAALSDDGKGKAHLYLDGRHHAESTLPAAFPVPGGVIEVASTSFGLKRCHYVTDEGVEYQLLPDRSSAEGRRERLDQEHPALSRWIGFVSLLLLVVPALLVVPQLVEVAFEIPPVAERFGTFTSPVHLPFWLNVALGLGAAVASTERALRLRYSWLDSVAQG